MATARVLTGLTWRKGFLDLCARSLTLGDKSRERLPERVGKPSSTSRESGAATVRI
jgi:hypothetical protein